MTSDQKFMAAMGLGAALLFTLWELVDAVYNVQVTLQLTDMKKATVIDG